MGVLEDLQARLDAYRAAELRCLQAQNYVIQGRSKASAELADIRKGIAELEMRIARLSGGSCRQVIIRD